MAWWKRGKSATEEQTAADTSLPLIRLEGVTRKFAGDDPSTETCALDNVTLDIDRSEYISISGPSGCGKSTLLSILALLDAPTSGRYWFNGRRMDQLSPGEKARIRNVDVGLIFQSFNLIGDMTVYENVEYPLTLRGVGSADRAARVQAALDRVGLTARGKQRPGSLSGGHQQLVAIARALAGRPPIVLADEPTGNLDRDTARAVFGVFVDLAQQNRTSVIIVTHDPELAARCHRVLRLEHGQLQPA
jgi:putative ABC transport system ATP-binding protein